MATQMSVVVCTHASASAFLFHGLHKGVISGLSAQTVVALTACTMLHVVKKVWYWLEATGGRLSALTRAWEFTTGGYFVSALLLLASIHMLHKERAHPKADSDKNKEDIDDDFGKTQVRHLWFMIPGMNRAPPAYLHWGLIYVGAFLMTLLTAWASCSFSFVAFFTWATNRPTAMMSIFDNYLRGLGLLPQLHVSRKAGVISPTLALWIAMQGVTDIIELVTDGLQLVNFCYIIGDVLAMLLVSDFMWLFFKSVLRGQKVVEIPMEYEV